MADIATLDRLFGDLKRQADRLDGVRAAVRGRAATLASEVGLAKGRLLHKSEVEDHLNSLQVDAHQRTIGAYSKMLTAVAQDVLPNADRRIGLDLFTKGGKPALELFAEVGEDLDREDILDSRGLSLSNVISLGLRAIATVKSGLRPFMAADEGDCWLATARVPAYYRVVKKLSESLGYQALVISHHNVGLFADGTNIIEVHGNPAAPAGLSVRASAGAAAWPDADAIGIRAIVLRDFASFHDATIPLSPGLNAIVGDNDIGKSRVMRALRSVAYAGEDTADSDIRHGKRRAEVEIHIEGGRILHWSREKRRNPICLWRLVESDGSVVEIDGVRCEGGLDEGRRPPSWVVKGLGIGLVEKLDIQLGRQATPIFLLDESAMDRAAVLSVGRESDHLRKMINLYREDCAADAKTVRDGERETRIIQIRLGDLDKSLTAIVHLLDEAEATRAVAVSAAATAVALENAVGRIERADAATARAVAVHTVLSNLPDAPPAIASAIAKAEAFEAAANRIKQADAALDMAMAAKSVLAHLPAAPPALLPSDDRYTAADRIEQADEAKTKAIAVRAVLAHLPAAPPVLLASDAMEAAGRRVSDANTALAEAKAVHAVLSRLPAAPPSLLTSDDRMAVAGRIDQADLVLATARDAALRAKMSETEAGLAVAEWFADNGNRCPTCGSAVDHTHVDNVLSIAAATGETL